MGQSAITVTPPSPSPPTNFSFLGQTPPNAPAQPVADDGSAGPLTTFATQTASVDAVNFPSVAHEGAGTETVVTTTYLPAYTGAAAHYPLVSFSDLGNYTTEPNKTHASSLSPATNPTLASISPTTAAKGTSGTTTITATGTGFTPGCRIWANNVEQTTTYVSATSLTAAVPKSPNAGVWSIEVKLGGVTVPSARSFTWT